MADEAKWRVETTPAPTQQPATEPKEDVSALATTPKSGGWPKGVSGNPAGKPKALRTAFKAIAEDMKPEEVAGYFRRGLVLAEKSGSAKAILGYLELYLAYTDGRPVQRIEEGGDKLEEFLLVLRANRIG